jgi:hypothetical protein
MWAVITTLAIFEPDYGSFLRHVSPVLPVLVALRVLVAAHEPLDGLRKGIGVAQ